MYYTIVGSSDNITGTTPAANVFTIYYAAPGSVIANFAPPIAINGSGVPFNISWTPVPNATLELYVSNQPISFPANSITVLLLLPQTSDSE